MPIEWNILWAFLAISAVLWWLGLFLNIFIRTKQHILLPGLGLIVFGGVIVPIIYLLDRYTTVGIFLMVLALGLVGVWFAWRRRGPWSWSRLGRHWWAGLGIGLIVSAGLIFSSKYYIPGGIDSAIHSGIINGIIIQGDRVQGPYPLGIHLLILFVERFFRLSQVAVFQGLNIFFFLSFFLYIYLLVRHWLKSRLAGLLAMAVTLVDVSYFNNLINGSISHLLGLQLMVSSIVLLRLTQTAGLRIKMVVFLILFSSFWYLHFLSLYFVFAAFWALRLLDGGDFRQTNLAWPLLGSLIVSLPIQRYLIGDPVYLKSSLPVILAVIIVESLFFYLGKHIKRFLSFWPVVLVSLPLLIWLFVNQRFLTLFSWYGAFLLTLTGIGVVLIITTRKKQFYSWYYYLFILFFLYFSAQRNFFGPGSALITELMYYYGFTLASIIVGTLGLWILFHALTNRLIRLIMLASISAFALTILTARTFDQPLVRANQADDRPISRYGQLSGFGIFYTKNDIRLAEWIKKMIPDRAVVMNPGGLYNDWASLTEHQVVLGRYNNPVITDYPPVEKNTIDLLRGSGSVDFTQFSKRNIGYILLPENFRVEIFNPQVDLIKQVGQARLYRIKDQADRKGQFYSLNLKDLTQSSPLKLSGQYTTRCRYCGNSFYFSFQDALYALVLPAGGMITLSLPPERVSSTVNVYFQVESGLVDVRINGQPADQTPSPDRSGYWNRSVPPGQSVTVSIHNVSNEQTMEIDALALEVLSD